MKKIIAAVAVVCSFIFAGQVTAKEITIEDVSEEIFLKVVEEHKGWLAALLWVSEKTGSSVQDVIRRFGLLR